MNDDDNFEKSARQTQLEEYYGGKMVRCWACGSKTFYEVRLFTKRWWIFRFGPAVLRATCACCKGENDYRPGSIRQSEVSSYTWIWIGKR